LLVYTPLIHWGVHSCPPRRSSDLERRGALLVPGDSAARRRARHRRAVTADVVATASKSRRCAGCCGVGAGERVIHAASREARERSEEHTSELQSREKRVCRLLLAR